MSAPLRLGSGAVAAAGAPPKAAMLDRAACAGLPVPDGVVVITADPSEARACLLACPVAVRSAFGGEDGAGASMAGRFTSVLGVDGADPDALEAAAGEVLASAAAGPATATAVLVMRMVPAVHAGVAFTERDHEDDLVNWTAGLADRLVSGDEPGARLTLPKLRRLERPGAAGPPFAGRLQVLLRDVRRVFGEGDWDVEWADDGRVCHLVQVRPVTRPAVRDETFTIANHKEILPPLPSRFMASMIGSCGDGLIEWFRRHDARVPAGRPLVEVFHGRPMINMSLLVDMTRVWGVPSRLVTDSLGGDLPGEAAGARPLRLLVSAPRLLRIGVAQTRAAAATRRTELEILRRTADPGDTFAACIETLRWEYRALVNQMAALTSAMSVPVSLLRRAGTLPEHSRRHRTAATAMADDLAELRALAARDPEARDELAAGRLPAGPVWEAAWRRWCRAHGHRGVFESDIARPRYAEEPAPILATAALPQPGDARPVGRTVRGRLTGPLWRRAAGPLAERERLRSAAMLGFARIRRRLLELADEAVADGRLPRREAIWDLEVDEVRLLDGGGRLPEGLLERRAREIAEDRAVTVPDLMRRFGGVPAVTPGDGATRGITLTPGTVTGTAWVLAEPSIEPPAGVTPPVVLIARSVDPGWIPTFARVAGVVVETGGDLSHGSIILRELGIPAITNVHGVTGRVRTGDRVELRAGAGSVRVVGRGDMTTPAEPDGVRGVGRGS